MTHKARKWGVLAALVAVGSAVGVVVLRQGATSPEAVSGGVSPGATLTSVGPRLLSNETSQPLSIQGERLVPGLTLALGPPLSRELPLTVVDSRHAYARLPADLALPEDTGQVVVEARLALAGGARTEGVSRLTVVNDAAFADLTAMALSPDGRTLFLASPTTDTVFSLDVEGGRVERLAAGDGPSALATWQDASGRPWLGVVHRYQPELRLYALDAPGSAPRTLPAPLGAHGLEVDGARGVAFIAEHVRDRVHAVSLADGKPRWTAAVDPNPRALARWKDVLAVGSLQTGQLELLRQEDGAPVATVAPGPGVAILGGHTEPFREQVMGGKAPRAVVASERLGRLFMASLGPNVGPNPKRMEVSNNSGVAVVDPAKGDYVRHRGFGAGVTEGLALDDAAGLLYAADVGVGRVRVLDARALAGAEKAARGAVLQEVALAPPANTPRIRPAEDFGTKGRAGEELHSGPRSLALAPDGRTLYVLNRFTRTVAVVDVREARAGRARVVRQWPVVASRAQAKRRLGQVLYYADLGRTGITCDGCHLEGHTGGVFYEKTRPNRIYRSTTVLGSRDTPPYFTPASQDSLAETASFVGGRNRFHNPAPSPEEVEALTLFNAMMATPPNPFRGADGAPLESVELPDGAVGNPARGRELFEGKGRCVECHPAPLYTLDQDPATRGKYLDVGTPVALPLRLEQQDLVPGAATPSLVGTWDVWPLLTSATAGYAVKDGRLVVGTRFPLRAVLEASGPKHGDTRALTPGERDDLLAFLLTL
ncbi:NHL repeat-containing protein [Pyxidicoccus xibeiensis]|uniref:MtsA protein n=1 Tax=Pyxidicoccus xibeiensis TaxID=2906759 RepID=UPI0020A72FFD|nr:MtsA protein [Pyxidicoccus xibeiensis]MCP3138998.1 MtsA protein [Pyxidicoccus xibeiensis]